MKNKEWFKDWSNNYDRTLGKIKRHHDMLDMVVKMSKVKKGDSVLDIGCGTGLLSLKFLNKTKCNVTGIDSSSQMLAIFKDKISKLKLQDRVKIQNMDAGKLKYKKNTFDVLASTVTLHHLKNKQPAFNKMYSILKPGGRLLIGDLDFDTTGNHNDPKRLRRILEYLNEEYILALKDGGVEAFSRMYDNAKKHILNEGEYCISFKQWSDISRKAGFKKITVKPVKSFKWFKVLCCEK